MVKIFTRKRLTNPYPLLALVALILLSFCGLAQTRGAKVGPPVVTGTPGRRMALVLGNKAYQFANPLKNPVNDAKDVKVALTKLGFEVSEVVDADYRGTISAINEFVAKLQTGDVVIFYYSGHGIGYNGKNYILPVDANINCIERIDEHGISLGRVLSDFEQRHVQTCFLFLDACRNMPALKACNSSQKALTTQGLVKPTNNPRGSMIVFATEEGTTADDNLVGRNGLFTGELLKYLTVPGIGIRSILDRTAAGVETQSSGGQSPARYDKLWGDFVFIEAAPSPNADPIKPVVIPKYSTPGNGPQGATSEFVAIKESSYKMGIANRAYNEAPPHEVQVSGFHMARHEITVSEWATYCRAKGKEMPTIPDVDDSESYWKGKDRYPITNITWLDAVEYANWLSEQQGLQKAYRIQDATVEWIKTATGYRLPTEAEWELAARGSTPDLPYAGSRQEQEVSWSQINSNDSAHPVGTKKANDLGLYDLSGNVWEWCWDWYDEYYYRKSEKDNPAGISIGTMRSIRGGSWLSANNVLTIRRGRSPQTLSTEIGFRLVRTD